MDFSESRCPEMEEMAEMGFREWKWAMRGVELCHTEPLARRRQSTETTESFNSHTDCTDLHRFSMRGDLMNKTLKTLGQACGSMSYCI